MLLLSCSSSNKEPLRIAVAASSCELVHALASEWQANSSDSIEVICNSSGVLASQILANAPFDIFISADTLYTNPIPTSYTHKTISKNQLVLWSKKPIHSIEKTFSEAKTLAIANPETAPFGALALEFITILFPDFKKDIVYGSNISQINQYISLESIDAAFTSKSSIYSLKSKGFNKGYFIEIADFNLEQGMVTLTPKGEAFAQYISDELTTQTFEKFGFDKP